jgi:hypothetical protein
MKILIGITQNPKEADEKIAQEFKISKGQTVVGPFMSSKNASDWLKFMMARSGGYEEIILPLNSSADDFWYGITVEYPEQQLH